MVEDINRVALISSQKESVWLPRTSGGEAENGTEIRNKHYNIICMCFIFAICFLLYFRGVSEYHLRLVFKCSPLVLLKQLLLFLLYWQNLNRTIAI